MGGETHINMVSYGGGVNSTALLVGLHQHRIPVDLILFADTGAEHPHTYAYLDIMDRWLKDHGMPPITRVYKTTRDGKRLTLEQECLQSGTLPSMAYGFKRCSLKHKIGPQEKQHHTLTQIMMGLLNNSFELKVVEEAEPPQEMMDIPGFQDELRRPMMLLVKSIARKSIIKE